MQKADAISAPDSVASKRSLRGTWSSLSKVLGLEPLPLTPEKIHTVCSVLVAGAYRSARSYVAETTQFHIRSGYPWDEHLEIVLKDAKREHPRGNRAIQRRTLCNNLEALSFDACGFR